MSWLRCDGCDGLIDTDACPEFHRNELDEWLCDACYEEHLAEFEDAKLDDPRRGQAAELNSRRT